MVEELGVYVSPGPVLRTLKPPVMGISELTDEDMVAQLNIGSKLRGWSRVEFMRGLRMLSKPSKLGKSPSILGELRGDSSRLRSRSSSELGGERGKGVPSKQFLLFIRRLEVQGFCWKRASIDLLLFGAGSIICVLVALVMQWGLGLLSPTCMWCTVDPLLVEVMVPHDAVFTILLRGTCLMTLFCRFARPFPT